MHWKLGISRLGLPHPASIRHIEQGRYEKLNVPSSLKKIIPIDINKLSILQYYLIKSISTFSQPIDGGIHLLPHPSLATVIQLFLCDVWALVFRRNQVV